MAGTKYACVQFECIILEDMDHVSVILNRVVSVTLSRVFSTFFYG